MWSAPLMSLLTNAANRFLIACKMQPAICSAGLRLAVHLLVRADSTRKFHGCLVLAYMSGSRCMRSFDPAAYLSSQPALELTLPPALQHSDFQ